MLSRNDFYQQWPGRLLTLQSWPLFTFKFLAKTLLWFSRFLLTTHIVTVDIVFKAVINSCYPPFHLFFLSPVSLCTVLPMTVYLKSNTLICCFFKNWSFLWISICLLLVFKVSNFPCKYYTYLLYTFTSRKDLLLVQNWVKYTPDVNFYTDTDRKNKLNANASHSWIPWKDLSSLKMTGY